MLNKKKIKFIFLSLIIIYIFIFSDVGIISKIKLDQKIELYEKKIDQLTLNNRILKKKISLLNNDYGYIADLARKLGYAIKGEKIYRFYQKNIITNTSKNSNIKLSFFKKYKIKNYLIYLITFLIAVISYIILLITAKSNKS